MLQLFCLTRTYILNRWVRGMTKCEGSDLLRETHCPFCNLYSPKETGEEPDEVDDPVIFETERAEWEENQDGVS